MWIVAGGVVIALLAFVAVRKGRSPGTALSVPVTVPAAPSIAPPPPLEPPAPERPSRIVLASGDEAVFAMTVLDLATAAKDLEATTRFDSRTFGRALEPLMQVAPSMATAGMAGSGQLMEVVINGPLAAAADGNGFRAMTLGADGIQQNARLFEPKALQNVANAAAIWQLASVAVAQKHLADISATLRRVEEKVAGVQSMLEEERAALIQSALNYIDDARQAMQQGEFLERTRDRLEVFETQLDQAGITLLQQIRRESGLELDTDTVGCEGEYQSALVKHQALTKRVGELVACAEVRLANWYLCSLYPDRSRMLEGRMQKIHVFMDEVHALNQLLADTLESDCRKIDARFTSDETIAERRAHVRKDAAHGMDALAAGVTRFEAIIARVDAVAADRSRPSRLLIETDGRAPTAIYLAHEQPVMPSVRIQQEELVACL